MSDKTAEDEPPPSGCGDVEVSDRIIREGVKDLTYALDRGDIKLGHVVASIYRTMERARRMEKANACRKIYDD
jgi:hypothetical protein